MSMSSIPRPSGSKPSARTIDLFWAGTASDGTKIYAPYAQALGFQVGFGAGMLVAKYPRETLQCLVWGSLAAACLYLISEQESTQKPSLKQNSAKRSRRK